MTRSGRSALSVGWRSALGGFALCAGIVSGCGGEDSTPGASAGGTELVGTQWVLDVAALGVSGAGSVNSWISFARGSVSGNDGCNAFSGSYEVDGSKLRFGPLAGTKKACGAPADEVSREVTGALGRVRGYATSADTLRMKDAGGETVLSYVAATPGVEGGWTVISVLYGDAIRSVVVGTDLTADFAADGTLSGNTGCNSFRGDYTRRQEAPRRSAHRDEGRLPDEGGFRAGSGLPGRARVRDPDRAGRPGADVAELEGADGRHAHALAVAWG
jgi:heat shock protein HslJ